MTKLLPASSRAYSYLETDNLDLDEAKGSKYLEVSDLVHVGLGSVVELLGIGPATENNKITVIGTASDSTVDVLPESSDTGGEEFYFWGEKYTVV